MAMDDVRVHYNSTRPAQLRALAFAQGTEIHVGPGHQRHLPHEAWHIVQQKQGRVRPTARIGAVGVNADLALEREADLMGSRASAGPGGDGRGATAAPFATASSELGRAPLQGKFVGQGSKLLDALTPDRLGAAGGMYAAIYAKLQEAKYVIDVNFAQGFNYEQKEGYGVLSVSEGILKMLDEGKAGALGPTYLGQLAHELSHARDHLVNDKKLPSGVSEARTLAILDTELRAWAIEAIVALQASPESVKLPLVKGWLELGEADTRSGILKAVYGHRKSNEVIARLVRYTVDAKFVESSPDGINAWISGAAVLAEQIAKLAASVAKALPAKGGSEGSAAAHGGAGDSKAKGSDDRKM
jgi:hypothetical protein